MSNKGLTKIMEECSELIQICAKKVAFMQDEYHPDGQFMRGEIEKEMADVLASIEFVINKWNLNRELIDYRMNQKLSLYNIWDEQPEILNGWREKFNQFKTRVLNMENKNE